MRIRNSQRNGSTSHDRVAEKLKCLTVFNWELKMKPNRFEKMREEMKEQLEEMAK